MGCQRNTPELQCIEYYDCDAAVSGNIEMSNLSVCLFS